MKLGLYLLCAMFLLACSSGSKIEPEEVTSDADVASTEGIVDHETVAPVCGDGTCEKSETCDLCPEDCTDCPEVCNKDGQCDEEAGETCGNCPEDCDECPDPCGDDLCDIEGGEDCASCPDDCPCEPECGNEECEEGEDAQTCPEDCNIQECPDGTCSDLETCDSCPDDCGECCGNDVCDEDFGENCQDCPDDCTCPGCGDGVLQTEDGEQCDDGNTAPDDGCDEECMIEPVEASAGDIIITEILKDPNVVQDTDGEWIELYNVTENDININGWVLMDDGSDKHIFFHPDGVIVPAESFFVIGRDADPAINGGVTLDYVYSNCNLANKDDEVILLSGSTLVDQVWYDDGVDFPDEAGKSLNLDPDGFDHLSNDEGSFWCDATEAFGDGDLGTPGKINSGCDVVEPVCGNGDCEEGEDEQNCPDDCTNQPCGDGDCDSPDENCDTCPQDCGDCCGNDVCEPEYQETCSNCPGDCDPCVDCGDGDCGVDEDCFGCPQDCDPCCGNGACDEGFGETCGNCEADCGPCCGNQKCEEPEGENCVTCEQDCGPCCGDEICTPNQGENCNSCPEDCDPCCPDGECQANWGETCSTCEADCGECPKCGDGQCLAGENCYTCPGDCGNCCGNQTCEPQYQETCQNCPVDCNVCCGNGQCEANFGETCATCEADCDPCCGNGQCQANFNENCTSCPADCGACPSADWCKLSGSSGAEVTCLLELAAAGAAQAKATGAEFILNFDGAKVDFTKFHDEFCMGENCMPWDTPPQGTIQPTGHTITSNVQSPGKLKVVIYHGSAPATPMTQAYLSGQNVVGDAELVELVFTLKTTISAGQAVQVSLTGLKATDADANPLTMTFTDGLLVTSDAGGDPFCGDQVCNGAETCTTCAADCGDCCGDGVCKNGETCTTCAADCGVCPVCGDGQCNGAETCGTCEADCGACPSGDWCKLSGSSGAEVSCQLELAATSAASPKATGAELVMNFDASKVDFTRFHDEFCIGQTCMPWDTPPQGTIQPTGHTLTFNEQLAGKIKVVMYHGSVPATPLTQAYMSGQSVVGDAELVELVFTLKTTISEGQPVPVTLNGLKATDASANPLTMTFQDGVLVTAQ